MAVKKKKKASKKKKPQPKWDKKTKRWRLKSKFVKPPKKKVPKKKVVKKKVPKKKVVKKKVPKKKVVKKKVPKKKVVKKKKPKKKPTPTPTPEPEPEPELVRVPVYIRTAGSVEGFSEPGSEAQFTQSSHGNRITPRDKIVSIFEESFVRHLNKTPFEADEILIYRYGILIRPQEGIYKKEIGEYIQEVLQDYPNSSMHIITEENTFSIRINLGSPFDPELAGNVSVDLNRNRDILGDIYKYIGILYDDVDWFVFWDTEDAIYE